MAGCAQVRAGDVVGVDGDVLGLASAAQLREALAKVGAQLRTDVDIARCRLADACAAAATVYAHDAAYVGASPNWPRCAPPWPDKGATHHFISTVDDIAWLFNLRGSGRGLQPVFLAHASRHPRSHAVRGRRQKIARNCRQPVARRCTGCRLRPCARSLAALPASAVVAGPPRDPGPARKVPGAAVRVVEALTPAVLLKAAKNAAEAAHIRQAMEQDGAAMCAFYAWFEAWPWRVVSI